MIWIMMQNKKTKKKKEKEKKENRFKSIAKD
jgi:hypothetical protein